MYKFYHTPPSDAYKCSIYLPRKIEAQRPNSLEFFSINVITKNICPKCIEYRVDELKPFCLKYVCKVSIIYLSQPFDAMSAFFELLWFKIM